jgi:hypothetical protein
MWSGFSSFVAVPRIVKRSSVTAGLSFIEAFSTQKIDLSIQDVD